MTLKKKVKQTSYTIHLYLYFCLAYPLCSTFQFRRRKMSQKWNETKTVGCKIRQVESKRCSARNQLENIPQHYIRISDGKNSTWFICLMFVACVILSALHFSSLHFNCRNWSGNSPMELANVCNAMCGVSMVFVRIELFQMKCPTSTIISLTIAKNQHQNCAHSFRKQCEKWQMIERAKCQQIAII